MAVPIDATGQFDAGVPQALFPSIAPRAEHINTCQSTP